MRYFASDQEAYIRAPRHDARILRGFLLLSVVVASSLGIGSRAWAVEPGDAGVAGTPGAAARPPLELRGLKPGDGKAAALAAFPTIECEPVGDGVERCWLTPGNQTLGGKKAAWRVALLDGVVTAVEAMYMDLGDAYAVMETLPAKYGAYDKQVSLRYKIRTAERTENPIFKIPAYFEQGDRIELRIYPSYTYGDKTGKSYAAVTLVDHQLHSVYQARSQGLADPSNL